MTRPVIRPARDEEAEEVADLFNAINSLDEGGPVVTMTGAHVRLHLLGPRPLSTLRVAEADGCIAGFITANLVYDSTRAAAGCIVVDLYVRPEARRDGATCLWWGVDEGDDEATAFYISLGAESEGAFEGRILVGAAYETLAAEAEA